MYAALAQQERQMISERTKAGLAAAKAQGVNWELGACADGLCSLENSGRRRRPLGRVVKSVQADCEYL